MIASNMLARRLASLSLFSRPIISSGKHLTKQRCLSSVSRTSTTCGGVALSADDVTLTSLHSRCFSSQSAPRTANNTASNKAARRIVEGPDGRQYAVVHSSRRKLKPSIVRRRLERMKTYEGNERNIRYSPFRLNLICRLVAGLPLLEALKQLEFCTKDKAPLVHKVLKRTSNLADIRDGLQMSQLEVAECFATHGHHVKGLRPMGRGRTGKTKKRYSHMRLVLREIDFPLRIYQAPSMNQKRKWVERQIQAENDAEAAQAERDELQRLEQQAAEKESSGAASTK